MTLRILGTGAYLPLNLCKSSELDRTYGRSEGWIEKTTGVRSRYFVGGESQIDMAVAAGQDAMSNAGVTASDLDLVIVGSAIPYQALPATAPLLQQRLGIKDGQAAAFDINASCLSFVAALDMVAAFFAARRYRRALIVSSEIASRGLPWGDRPDIAGLFSDGAAAVVAEPAPGRPFTAHFASWPSGWEACQVQAGGTRHDPQALSADDYRRLALFSMDGAALFRLTSRHFRKFLNELLDKAGWTKEDVDVVVPHQASPAGLEHMIRLCGFDHRQVVNIASTHGNHIAASIPIALHHARSTGLLREGASLLMLGTSAGVSFGGIGLRL